MEKVESVERPEIGTLTQISTDGEIGFSYGQKKIQSISLDGSNQDAELLRDLWATQVGLDWVEQTTSHPRRSSTRGSEPQEASNDLVNPHT